MTDKKLVRHELADRLLHWLFAAAVLTLIVTGFLPILGINFEWVTVHWIAGIAVLVFLVLHVLRHITLASLTQMWIGWIDFKLAWVALRTHDAKTGKYSIAQKLMHHGVAGLVVGTLITGLLMMVRIDTPFWERNIYLFEDGTWGVIYALHGLSAMALITTIMLHIYFALRPEKMLYTRSMLQGWLTQQEYDEHHEQELWPIDEDIKNG
ncbi:MAG: formate dehydrogenase subunit gamma [Limisphaerales bacterium]|jgi:formate dehydrogenase subunit gamma